MSDVAAGHTPSITPVVLQQGARSTTVWRFDCQCGDSMPPGIGWDTVDQAAMSWAAHLKEEEQS